MLFKFDKKTLVWRWIKGDAEPIKNSLLTCFCLRKVTDSEVKLFCVTLDFSFGKMLC